MFILRNKRLFGRMPTQPEKNMQQNWNTNWKQWCPNSCQNHFGLNSTCIRVAKSGLILQKCISHFSNELRCIKLLVNKRPQPNRIFHQNLENQHLVDPTGSVWVDHKRCRDGWPMSTLQPTFVNPLDGIPNFILPEYDVQFISNQQKQQHKSTTLASYGIPGWPLFYSTVYTIQKYDSHWEALEAFKRRYVEKGWTNKFGNSIQILFVHDNAPIPGENNSNTITLKSLFEPKNTYLIRHGRWISKAGRFDLHEFLDKVET